MIQDTCQYCHVHPILSGPAYSPCEECAAWDAAYNRPAATAEEEADDYAAWEACGGEAALGRWEDFNG